MKKNKDAALNEAIASAKMEGYAFSEEKKQLCYDILNGKISYERFLEDCKTGNFPLKN